VEVSMYLPIDFNEVKLQYPLQEKIGPNELLIGREPEFKNMHKWINNIPKKMSKSRVLLGRRKSGKTTFMQRIFNQVWSANGDVVPFFISIPEKRMWYRDFIVEYFRTFASQYISFYEQDPLLVKNHLDIEQILEYAKNNSHSSLEHNTQSIMNNLDKGYYGVAWSTIYRLPHILASIHEKHRILVMIDEFQYLANHIYMREDLSGEPDDYMPGSFHEVSESKVAPMLVTGSYVGWMLDIMGKHLEAGRLSQIPFSPYLTEKEGLRAVYTYAEVYEEPISNKTALQINKLCHSDPFFISCVVQSNNPTRDLSEPEGVIQTVDFEVQNRKSEMSETWREYIDLTVDRINDTYGKKLLLHLSKHNNRYWTPKELKAELALEETETAIHRRLLSLVKADLVEWGPADIEFRGLKDGTLNLILRSRFEREIVDHVPDLKADFRAETEKLLSENKRLKGQLRDLKGKSAEYIVVNGMRTKKKFRLSQFFEGVTDDTRLNIIDVRPRIYIYRDDDKKMELDVVAKSSDGHAVLVEVKNWDTKVSASDVGDFMEKVEVYRGQNPNKDILCAFVSMGGFTKNAQDVLDTSGIAWTTDIDQF
ncbi:MAG: restriction endonuclease, partial [Chloroflexota bacterium]